MYPAYLLPAGPFLEAECHDPWKPHEHQVTDVQDQDGDLQIGLVRWWATGPLNGRNQAEDVQQGEKQPRETQYLRNHLDFELNAGTSRV